MNQSPETIDVTKLVAAKKHPAVFERFDLLKDAESFIISNDHDPKPLYYQLLGEKGRTFQWTYLEKGPLKWRVLIEKNKQTVDEKTIGEIASEDMAKIEVFRRYGIDFCCGGKKTVIEVCKEKGLNSEQLLKELETSNISKEEFDPSGMEIDLLCEYIVNKHHSYINKELPFIIKLSEKVAAAHNDEHPELDKIKEQIVLMGNELMAHMQKEEKVLFPYIKAITEAQREGTPLQKPIFESVDMPVRIMEMEHEEVGEILAEIKVLCNNYILPSNACNSYTLLYEMLMDFENDLKIHIHLENNILFPKAISAETLLLEDCSPDAKN